MLPRYVNITDGKGLVRDTFSMGIINTNMRAMAASNKRHQDALDRIAEQRRKDHELNTLRKDVAELKEMVLQLVMTKGT